MNITQIGKGYAHKAVFVEGIMPDRPVSDDMIIGFAMHAAGETPGSLMGWSIRRYEHDPTRAFVRLNTD